MPRDTRFFEEAPGVKSSSRLVGFLMTLATLALVATIIFVAIRDGEHAANIIYGIAAAMGGAAGGTYGVMRTRGTGSTNVPPEDR